MGRLFKFAESEIQHSGVTSKKKFDVIELLPEVEGTFTYNGEVQYPTWRNLDPLKVLVTGEKSAVDAGIHTITVTPIGNFGWADNSQTPLTFTWEIKRKKISGVPSQKNILTFNNSPQSPTWNNYNPAELDVSGIFSSQTNAGIYDAIFTPNKNYCWADGSIESKIVSWTISFLKIPKPFASNTKVEYTGAAVTLAVTNYNADYMTRTGSITETAKGNYSVSFALNDSTNVKWSDNSTANVVIDWSITNKQIIKPTLEKTSLPYNARVQAPNLQNFNSTYMTKSGRENATYPDNFQITIALKDKENTCWADGSTADLILNWQITKLIIPKFYLSTTELVYNGNHQIPDVVGWDSSKYGGVLNYYYQKQINVGHYNFVWIEFKPDQKEYACWDDGSTNRLDLTGDIVPAPLPIPTVEYDDEDFGAYVYTGSEITAEFKNFDSSKMSVTGNTATTAASHTAKFTITNSNYCFTGGATVANVTWKIAKEQILFTVRSNICFVNDDGSVGTVQTKYVGIDQNPMFSYTRQRNGMYIYLQYPMNCTYTYTSTDNLKYIAVEKSDYGKYITLPDPPAGWTEGCWFIENIDKSKGGSLKVKFEDTAKIKADRTTTVLKWT